jgi:hypothetical protein
MGRSWASYEEENNTKKKIDVTSLKTDKDVVCPPSTPQPFDYALLRKKLTFGALVGLSTGMTFGLGTVDSVIIIAKHAT